MISAFLALLKALPEIISLIKLLQAAAKSAETDRTVKSDIAAIHTAIASKNVTALNEIMNK